MIEVDTLYKRSDNNILTIFNIIKRRLETEDLKPEIRAIFIINHDILLGEIQRRGLTVENA
jgi:hypothetical protein